ncbi:Neurexophilin [Branchiostoma belcheri]|nr:Neurexophilin [Branchiostoma belcheri]
MGKHSVAFVMNPQPVYHVGDTLFIKIVARDAKHRPKFYGGDFLRAKLFSRVPVNASTAGRITDYENGTYVARFFLSWPGSLSVSVQIIHPKNSILRICCRASKESKSGADVFSTELEKNHSNSALQDCQKHRLKAEAQPERVCIECRGRGDRQSCVSV